MQYTVIRITNVRGSRPNGIYVNQQMEEIEMFPLHYLIMLITIFMSRDFVHFKLKTGRVGGGG